MREGRPHAKPPDDADPFKELAIPYDRVKSTHPTGIATFDDLVYLLRLIKNAGEKKTPLETTEPYTS